MNLLMIDSSRVATLERAGGADIGTLAADATAFTIDDRDLATLEQAGIGNLGALVAGAADYVRRHPPGDWPRTSGQLSSAEVEILRSMGARGLDAEESAVAEASRSNLQRLAMEYGQMVAGADSLEMVTTRLGVKPSRVRQRLGDRSLYAIDGPGGKVFPRFQFTGNGVLPGFGQVLARIDPDKHPVAVQRFFLEPTSALESDLDDDPVSPRDWLLAGLPVEPVVRYAELG